MPNVKRLQSEKSLALVWLMGIHLPHLIEALPGTNGDLLEMAQTHFQSPSLNTKGLVPLLKGQAWNQPKLLKKTKANRQDSSPWWGEWGVVVRLGPVPAPLLSQRTPGDVEARGLWSTHAQRDYLGQNMENGLEGQSRNQGMPQWLGSRSSECSNSSLSINSKNKIRATIHWRIW